MHHTNGEEAQSHTGHGGGGGREHGPRRAFLASFPGFMAGEILIRFKGSR